VRSPSKALALAILAIALLGGCGKATQHTPRAGKPKAPASAPGPVFGITEDDANLLWSPDADHQPGMVFRAAQSELSALKPTYLRILIDWAALQPNSRQPPQLNQSTDGCDRQIGPCGAYQGIREELAAVASQQHAGGGFQVVIDIFGAPPWAARASAGCERKGTEPFSRPLLATALGDYRELVHSLLALASEEGVELPWWSPWNEPNNPYFLSPQRGQCTLDSPALAPAAYAELTGAMAEALATDPSEHHLLLGELGDYLSGSPERTSISEFIAALPEKVICMGDVWAVHAYVSSPGKRTHRGEPVRALEEALDARGTCGRSAPIWVTETGSGAEADVHRQQPNPLPSASGQLQGCRALADQLRRWDANPRIGAIFQYTFREDPDFPVGLISAGLAQTYPTYALWLAWSRAPSPAGRAALLAQQCV
jgi:hypothetical protein